MGKGKGRSGTSTVNQPNGTHTGKDGRQVPNSPGPLAREYKRQTGRY